MRKTKYIISEGYGGAGYSLTPNHRIASSGSYGSGGGTFNHGMYSYSIVPLNKTLEQRPSDSYNIYNIAIGAPVKGKTIRKINEKSKEIKGILKSIVKNDRGDIKYVIIQDFKDQSLVKADATTVNVIVQEPIKHRKQYINYEPSKRRMVKESLNEENAKQNDSIKTWGDFKKVLKGLINKKRLYSAKTGALDVAIEQISGLIPGASNLKNAYDFFSTIYRANDKKKSKTWIDKLNVDDKFSSIVDDSVENQFIKHLGNMIINKPDNELIPEDFNINEELIEFLRNNFENRTLTIKGND